MFKKPQLKMKQYQTLQDLIVFNTKWQITFLANIKQQKTVK